MFKNNNDDEGNEPGDIKNNIRLSDAAFDGEYAHDRHHYSTLSFHTLLARSDSQPQRHAWHCHHCYCSHCYCAWVAETRRGERHAAQRRGRMVSGSSCTSRQTWHGRRVGRSCPHVAVGRYEVSVSNSRSEDPWRPWDMYCRVSGGDALDMMSSCSNRSGSAGSSGGHLGAVGLIDMKKNLVERLDLPGQNMEGAVDTSVAVVGCEAVCLDVVASWLTLSRALANGTSVRKSSRVDQGLVSSTQENLRRKRIHLVCSVSVLNLVLEAIH